MLYYNFKDYEGFKELFGLRECGNGEKARRNKILLSYVKQHSLLKGAIAGDDLCRSRMNLTNMSDLLWAMKRDIRRHAVDDLNILRAEKIELLDWTLYSEQYMLDENKGICEDRDYKKIRYVKKENGRVFKMKAGRFLKEIILETEWGRSIPEAVLLWMCEEFTQQWETHSRSILPEYDLHVDDNFGDIYEGDSLEGDFHSCMVDENNHSFYEDYVGAKAAYLKNRDGMIIARCVIFTQCHLMDGSGRVVRLAERQYSTDGEDVLKRCLVDALIKAGEIDGYKRVGADCHSGHAFVWNDGSALSCDMYIDCSAKDGDTCSYMDSFKYLNTDEERAYNSCAYDYDADLATTGGYVEAENRNWDSWNDCYTRNVIVTVYYHGREYTCDEDRLDDFVWVSEEQDYYHQDDVAYCDKCGNPYVIGDEYHSDITGEDYCCCDCMDDAEQAWLKVNGSYSEYDCQYYKEEDVTEFINSQGDTETISRESLDRLIGCGVVHYDEDEEIWSKCKVNEEVEC